LSIGESVVAERVVVSGGAGFIGSHLCESFLRDGYEVVAVDNFITGSRANVAAGIEVIDADVSKPFDVPGPIAAVLHLASPASPVDFERIPIEILETGTTGTWRMLELAQKNGARFLVASTSEVYGDPLVNPQPETYWGNVNTVGIRGCYDEAKRCAEAITMAHHRSRGMDTRIIRIFNTHGPRMRFDDGRAVPSFLNQALRGEPVTVFGDGSQTRSLCYVDDLVAGIRAVLDRGNAMPYNLGNPVEVTVLDIARLTIKLTGSSSEVVFKPLPQDDPKQRCPDITRARSELGWEPKVGLEEGLRRTLDYFKNEV
jgi:dTDP-glucose 4,6-dehydratase